MVIDMNAPLKYNKERYLKELRENELIDELSKKVKKLRVVDRRGRVIVIISQDLIQ